MDIEIKVKFSDIVQTRSKVTAQLYLQMKLFENGHGQMRTDNIVVHLTTMLTSKFIDAPFMLVIDQLVTSWTSNKIILRNFHWNSKFSSSTYNISFFSYTFVYQIHALSIMFSWNWRAWYCFVNISKFSIRILCPLNKQVLLKINIWMLQEVYAQFQISESLNLWMNRILSWIKIC